VGVETSERHICAPSQPNALTLAPRPSPLVALRGVAEWLSSGQVILHESAKTLRCCHRVRAALFAEARPTPLVVRLEVSVPLWRFEGRDLGHNILALGRHCALLPPAPQSVSAIATNFLLLSSSSSNWSARPRVIPSYRVNRVRIARTFLPQKTNNLAVAPHRAGGWCQVLTLALPMGLQRIYVFGSLERPLELAVDPGCGEKP